MKNKVIIFGGTGFIGQHLAMHLSNKGYLPIIIGRKKPRDLKQTFIPWDAKTLGNWTKQLEGALAVVNLCGRSVDCIKTPSNCDQILRSRVDTTKLIGKAFKKTSNAPKIWIQMSTAHIYGDPPNTVCTEDSSFGYGLAPFVGQEWEKALLQSLPLGTREVRIRTSFVIGPHGGAFDKLKRIAKLGLGGKVGSGHQGLSWIHSLDVSQFILFAIENTSTSGPYILSAPKPVSQKKFMKTLRHVYRIPFGLPNPSLLIKIGAPLLFKSDPDLLLYGRYVMPKRITEETHFHFKYKELEHAIQANKKSKL
jgi:hypothetical protein